VAHEAVIISIKMKFVLGKHNKDKGRRRHSNARTTENFEATNADVLQLAVALFAVI